MIALLRFALLKSWRDGSLKFFLAAPAVMLLSPILGVAAVRLLRGQWVFPLSLDPRIPAGETSNIMASVGIVSATLCAGIAAFWIFREEVKHRSIGTLILAARSRTIALAAILYATIGSLAGYFIVIVSTAILTTHIPAAGTTILLLGMSSCLGASAFGVVMVTISADRSMLVPVAAGSLLLSYVFFQLSPYNYLLVPLAIVFGALLLATSATLLERRCAV